MGPANLRFAVLALVLAAAPAAGAQTNRYSMTPVEGGALRLDMQTGEVSHCTPQYGSWTCRGVADDMAKLKRKLGALELENKSLRTDIERLQPRAKAEPEPGPAPPPDANPPVAGEAPHPGDQEIDQMMAFLEKMARRLKGMVEDLKREQPEPGTKDL